MFRTIKLRRALEKLQSKDQKVRVEAAATLGQLRDSRAVEPLVHALQNQRDYFVQIEAARALGEIKDPQAAPHLIAFLDHAYSEVQQTAVVQSLKQFQNANVVELLIAAVQDTSSNQRREGAAQALGLIGDARAVEPLVRTLQDGSSNVRREAAQALGRIGDVRAVEPLTFALQNEHGRKDGYYGVCVAAAQALGRIGDARAVGPLVAALQDQDWRGKLSIQDRVSGKVPEAAMQALVQIGATAVEPLAEALKDKDKNVIQTLVRRVVEALGLIRDERAVEPLMEVLKDPRFGWITVEASRALASIGLLAMPTLLRELNDGDNHIRKIVLDVLGKTEGNAAAVALPHVIAFLSDPKEEMRDRAVNALRGMGSAAKEAVPFLVDRWNEVENPKPILDALVGIGRVEDPRIIDPLLKLLFAAPQRGIEGTTRSIQTVLLAVVPFSPLTEELVNWIVKASTYEHKYRGYNHDAGYITLAVSDEAVPHLCRVNSPVTSNVLHLIAQKKDITVTMSTGCSPDWQETVSFQGQRDLALAELKRRGNPPYQPEAYLVRGAEIKELKKQAGTEHQKEKAERYRLLLSLVRNPRTRLSQDKWAYYDELTRDFKTVEVFQVLASDLAKYHNIRPHELSRFESLLVEVGQNLRDREVRSALSLVQTAWPRTAANVIEQIKKKRSQKS